MTSISHFGLALGGAAWMFALGCGGQAEASGDEGDQNPRKTPAVATAAQQAAEGLETAYRALCVCQKIRLPEDSCDAETFDGYDPDAVRETLELHAERGDGFPECIRDIVERLSACLTAEHGCERGACPDAASLLDDSMVLDELGESCPRQ